MKFEYTENYPALFEYTPTEKEYVLIGAVTNLEAQEDHCKHHHKIEGVLLLPLRGSSILSELLPAWVSYDEFVLGTIQDSFGELIPIYRYKGRFTIPMSLDYSVRGKMVYAYREISEEIIKTKGGSPINSKGVRIAPCVVGGVYRHYRNAKLYQILCLAKDHSNRDQDIVLYSSVDDPSQVWSRAYEEFFSNIITDDGIELNRFTFCYIA